MPVFYFPTHLTLKTKHKKKDSGRSEVLSIYLDLRIIRLSLQQVLPLPEPLQQELLQ